MSNVQDKRLEDKDKYIIQRPTHFPKINQIQNALYFIDNCKMETKLQKTQNRRIAAIIVIYSVPIPCAWRPAAVECRRPRRAVECSAPPSRAQNSSLPTTGK